MRFEITLKSEVHINSPDLIFKVNDNIALKVNDFVDNEVRTVIFEANVNKGKNQLVITRQNKTNDDTLVEDGKVVKDTTVKVLEVLMDRYVVGRTGVHPFLLDSANFFPQYPEPWLTEQKQKGKTPPISYNHCQILHHNGDWKLDFEDPVGFWFFEYYAGKRKFR